jgi:hypothetical protein
MSSSLTTGMFVRLCSVPCHGSGYSSTINYVYTPVNTTLALSSYCSGVRLGYHCFKEHCYGILPTESDALINAG